MANVKPIESVNATCCAQSGYNLTDNKSDVTIGHVTGFAFIKGNPVDPDVEVPDPENSDSFVPVLGPMDSISWGGDPTDPLVIQFRVSQANKAKIQNGLNSAKGGSEISIKFNVYEYSDSGQCFFKFFHSDDKDIRCTITPNSRAYVSHTSDDSVKSQKNYVVSLSLTGLSEGEQQKLAVAYAKDENTLLNFGGKKK